MAISKKTPRGRQSKRSGAAPRASKKAKSANKADQAATCQATTVKGTSCRLKAREGSRFCARHADVAETTPTSKTSPTPATMKNGQQKTVRKKAKKAVKKPETKTGQKQEPVPASDGSGKAGPVSDADPGAPKVDPEGDVPVTQPDDKQAADASSSETDPDAFYGSEFSTTMEASPYDDLITPEMADGEEDVELRDEQEFGRDQRRPGVPPRLSREQAEEQARKRFGPRPGIAPEEDLDGVLVQYDRRFESEVRRLMGQGQRKRGRRGGRRRKGGGGPPGGGPRSGAGGGGRPRRGRRGGRSRQGGGGGRGGGAASGSPSRRSGPTSSAARKVGRDSPLAQKRSSKGPKRGFQPRRRREPDV